MARGDEIRKLFYTAAKKYLPQEASKLESKVPGLMMSHAKPSDAFMGMNADGHARVWMGSIGAEASVSPSSVVKSVKRSLKNGGEISTPMMKSLEQLAKLPRNKTPGAAHD